MGSLSADPGLSLSIDEATTSYRNVLARGRADFIEETNVGVRWVAMAC